MAIKQTNQGEEIMLEIIAAQTAPWVTRRHSSNKSKSGEPQLKTTHRASLKKQHSLLSLFSSSFTDEEKRLIINVNVLYCNTIKSWAGRKQGEGTHQEIIFVMSGPSFCLTYIHADVKNGQLSSQREEERI